MRILKHLAVLPVAKANRPGVCGLTGPLAFYNVYAHPSYRIHMFYISYAHPSYTIQRVYVACADP